MILLGLALSSLQAAPAAPTAAQLATAERPHIVLFMIDDLGWRDTGEAAWGTDHPGTGHFLTPHIDRLAASGVRVQDAYAAAPVCTPSRTSLMTGQEPARTGITYWTKDKDVDTSAPYPPLQSPPWRLNGLQPGDATLATRLQAVGYTTIHAGKAHFGTGDGGDPARLGFDVNIAGWAAGGPGSYYGIDHFSSGGRRSRRTGKEVSDHRWDVPGLDDYHGKEVFLTDVLATLADEALRKAVADRGDEGRVFLHFAPYAVHAPLMVHPGLAERFPDLEGPELAYATLVAAVDDAVGKLLGTLDDLGIAEETLVVFTGDNGGLSAHGRGGAKHTHNAPLRSGKGSAYEGGVRVPMIARWPGVTKAGSVAMGPAVTQDLFPTFLGAAGADIRDAGATGIDLRQTLAGGDVEMERSILWHQPHYWGVAGPGIEPFSALRKGRYKLIWFHSSPGPDGVTPESRMELYDLVADASESQELSATKPDVLRDMVSALRAQLVDASAGLPIDLNTGKAIALPRVPASEPR